jgi:hypothetical protein
MTRRRPVSILVVVCLAFLAAMAYAAKSAPLVATFSEVFGVGVSHDGDPVYEHGLQKVQCYFGVNGRDANLVTYNSTRRLEFTFDANSPAFQASGLPSSNFTAQVDLFGINYYGPYRTMGEGTTAQVQMDLEFKVGKLTYELDYPSLAAMRNSPTTWLVTSNPGDIPGNPGFVASDLASLNVIRRRSVEKFGAVNMPIRFEVVLK